MQEYRSSDNSLGGGRLEALGSTGDFGGVQEDFGEFRSCRSTGVQTIAWEAEGWRLWGVQGILGEFRRSFGSSGVAGVQEFRQ